MKHHTIDKKVFEEYQENEKRKTICLFKSFTLFLLFTDIFFTFFLINFKLQLSQTKTTNTSTSTQLSLYQSQYKQQETKTQHMLVNIFATINTAYNSLTDIIHSIEEYNKIISYANMDGKINAYICYQGSLDGDNYEGYHKYCGLFPDQIILIELVDGTRIGAYISNAPYNGDEDDDEVVVSDPNVVLFNIDNGASYKINDPYGAFTVYKKGFFKIGKNDIFVANNYLINDESFSEFPSQFGNSDVEKYSLTNGNRKLQITQMEVFTLWKEDEED